MDSAKNVPVGKVLLLDACSFRADPDDMIWAFENVAQILYAEAQNKEIVKYLGADVVAKMHGQVEYISNYGLLMLGYLLKQNNIPVAYTNGDYFANETAYIEDILEKYSDYNVYCFTSTTPQFNHVRRLAQAVKAINPEAKTILGGPHTRYFLTHEKDAAFDYVVTGYGINKDVELIKSIFDGNEPNFWRIDTTEYYDCPKDFSLIPEERRMDTLWYNFFSIGCPNRCKYCVEHKVGKSICFVDISKRMDEVEHVIKTYGVKMFHFSDSDLFINNAHFIGIVNEIARRGIKCTFTFNTSPNFLIKVVNNPELKATLKEFVENGLIEILLGAEHFSENVRQKVSKHYKLEDFQNALDIAKHEIKVPIISLYSMVGLPFEMENDIDFNVKVFQDMRRRDLFDFTFPKFFVPYPDSEIYMHPEDFGIEILSNNFDDYHRWRTPRPLRVIGMEDALYIQEILDIIKTNKDFDENEVRNQRAHNKFFI